jgi:hypothetical protein
MWYGRVDVARARGPVKRKAVFLGFGKGPRGKVFYHIHQRLARTLQLMEYFFGKVEPPSAALIS